MPSLHWPEKNQLFQIVIDAIQNSTFKPPSLPFIVQGDATELVPMVAGAMEGRVNLVYMDPPFGTGESFSHKGKRGRGRDVIYADPADEDEYLSMLYPVLLASHRMLAPDGSLYVHLDHRREHLVRVLLDEIFGPGTFRSMVVWKRDPGGKGAKARARQWPRNIDVLLWYSRSPSEWRFSMEWRSLTPEQERAYRHRDPDGRRFKAVQLGDYSAESIRRMEEQGLIHVSRTGKKYKKYYLDEARRPVDAVWDDIPGFGTRTASKEYVGYPTQKPIALLERIVRAHTNPGDIVFDPFLGSGTTAVAAARLGRNWFGVEKSATGIETVLMRLEGDSLPTPVVVDSGHPPH